MPGKDPSTDPDHRTRTRRGESASDTSGDAVTDVDARLRIAALQAQVARLNWERNSLREQVESLEAKRRMLEETLESKERQRRQMIENYERILDERTQRRRDGPTLSSPVRGLRQIVDRFSR